MKKLITMLSALTITFSSAPLPIVCNKDKINKLETKFIDSIKIKEIIDQRETNKTENFNDSTLGKWIEVLLKEDCLKNFGKHFRLNAIAPAFEIHFLTWEDITTKFESFLRNKYEINFEITVQNNERNNMLMDGFNKKRINVKLLKKDNKWTQLTTKLYLHIWINDIFKILIFTKMYNEFKEFTYKVDKNNINLTKIIPNLKKYISSEKRLSDMEVELNEDSLNFSEDENGFSENFIHAILRKNDCFMPIRLCSLQSKFNDEEIEKFSILSSLIHFIMSETPHFNLKSKLLKNESDAVYTYKDFVNYLFPMFYMKCFHNKYKLPGWVMEHMLTPWKLSDIEFIKIAQQDKIFTDGENILKLLVAKAHFPLEYIEYNLLIDWYDGIKVLNKNDYKFYEWAIIEKFHYPEGNAIESSKLKAGQPQKNAYNLILEKIKDHVFHEELMQYSFMWSNYSNVDELLNILRFNFIKPDKPLKKGHNMVNVYIEVLDDFKAQVDFHINLID